MTEAGGEAGWRRVSLAVCMFLITAVFGFLQPFVPLYLAAAGLTKGQIGLVVGVGTGLTLLIQPLLGRLSDRLDARRPVMVLAALAAGGAYLAYNAVPQGGVAWFLLLTTLGANGTAYLNAVVGVLVGRMVRDQQTGGAAYAGYRVWGSVGYIVVSLTAGLLLTPRFAAHAGQLGRHVLAPIFADGPWLFLAIALVALLVPDRRGPAPVAPKETTPRLRAGIPRNVRWFLLAFFLYQFALYGASSYLSLYLKQIGASPLWITGTFAAGVVCEVLVMTRVGRWSDVHGRRPALAIAFAILPLRLLAYVPARTPFEVLLVQLLHGLNFGIMGAVAVAFVNDLAEDGERGAAQARLAGVQGLATALGPVACGLIAQRLGISWMFASMAGVGAVAAVVFLARVHESHPSPLPLRGPTPMRPFLRALSMPLRGANPDDA